MEVLAGPYLADFSITSRLATPSLTDEAFSKDVPNPLDRLANGMRVTKLECVEVKLLNSYVV
jgi:hypothetical protein